MNIVGILSTLSLSGSLARCPITALGAGEENPELQLANEINADREEDKHEK